MRGELNAEVKGRLVAERRRDGERNANKWSEGNGSLIKENGERV